MSNKLGIIEGILQHKADVEAMKKKIEHLTDLIATSGGLRCPNTDCNDQGFTPEQDGTGEWYQEQCQWCYTVEDSVFMRAKANREKDMSRKVVETMKTPDGRYIWQIGEVDDMGCGFGCLFIDKSSGEWTRGAATVVEYIGEFFGSRAEAMQAGRKEIRS